MNKYIGGFICSASEHNRSNLKKQLIVQPLTPPAMMFFLVAKQTFDLSK
jgi:hypothetical protein